MACWVFTGKTSQNIASYGSQLRHFDKLLPNQFSFNKKLIKL
jgi:hypothetical protein